MSLRKIGTFLIIFLVSYLLFSFLWSNYVVIFYLGVAILLTGIFPIISMYFREKRILYLSSLLLGISCGVTIPII